MIKVNEEIIELRGIAKILDCLWEGSANEKNMDERIEKELVYFFGENWTKDMYKFAGIISNPTMPRPLKEIIKSAPKKKTKKNK